MKSVYFERANHIATDNVSSAQQILRDALDLLFDFSMNNHNLPDFSPELKSLSTTLSSVQSQMSALSNVCRLVVAASDKLKPTEVGRYLDGLRKRVGEASLRAALEASKFISAQKTYATLSQSEFVIKSFEQAAIEKKFATIYVMESRPLFEGRQTARSLAKMGHHPILVSDASIGIFISELSSAFVGADSILSDGTVINKVGSYSLAACCALNKKNFYVVTSVLKYNSEQTAESFINKEENTHEIFASAELSEWTPPAQVRNLYFDKVKPELVTAIITESGGVSPVSSLEKLKMEMEKLYC